MHRLPTGGNVKNALKSFQKPHFRYGQCTLDIKLRKLKKDETPRTAEALESVWQEQCPSGRPLVKVHRSGWNTTQLKKLTTVEHGATAQLKEERKWVASMKPNPPRSSSTFAAWRHISTSELGLSCLLPRVGDWLWT